MEESPKTLRDEFAMAALNGLLANKDFHGPVYQGATVYAVRDAFEIADAMMAARAQAQTQEAA